MWKRGAVALVLVALWLGLAGCGGDGGGEDGNTESPQEQQSEGGY